MACSLEEVRRRHSFGRAGSGLLWNRVIPMPTPGMATADTADSEPEPFKYPMFLKSFHCIVRAGRCKPAFRTQPW